MKFTARVIDGWLPLTPEAISALEWREGDTIEVEICGDTLLAHKPIVEGDTHEDPKRPRRTRS